MAVPAAARAFAERRPRLARLGDRLGADEARRSLPVRRSGGDLRTLWDDPGTRDAVLDGIPVHDAPLEIGGVLDDWGTVATLRLRFATAMPKPVARALAGKAVRRLKALAETGEVPTTAHNPSGRPGAGEDAR